MFPIEAQSASAPCHSLGMAKHGKPRKRARPRHYLLEWRKKFGMTQAVLAERIGYSRSYYANIESGKRHYDQELLEALTVVYKCSIGDLIMRDPNEPSSILSIWQDIPDSERPRLQHMLEAFREFRTKSGKN